MPALTLINGRRSPAPAGRLELSGQRFGRLHVVRFVGVRARRSWWLCRCECGAQPVVRGDRLTDSHQGTRSCGCLMGVPATPLASVLKTPAYEFYKRHVKRSAHPIAQEWQGCEGAVAFVHWFIRHRPKIARGTSLTLQLKDPQAALSPANCQIVPLSSIPSRHRLALDGRRFGALTVVRSLGSRKAASLWLCRCDCGRQIEVLGYKLTRGNPKRCRACRRQGSALRCAVIS